MQYNSCLLYTSNIARYAYHPEVGEATIRCEVGGEPLQVVIQFMDGGKPYNPLEKDDPDTTLGVEEREIGGLGIFMVKKSMDKIDYEYSDGKNILTIKTVSYTHLDVYKRQLPRALLRWFGLLPGLRFTNPQAALRQHCLLWGSLVSYMKFQPRCWE